VSEAEGEKQRREEMIENETRISSILRLKQLESLVYHHHVGYARVINAFSENQDN